MDSKPLGRPMRASTLSLICLLIAVRVQGWEPGVEYTYSYNARAVSGLWDLQMQFGAVAIRANVTIQSVDHQTLLIKFSGVTAKLSSNYGGNPYYEEKETNDLKNLDIDIHGERVDIENLELVERPFEVKHNKGSIFQVSVSAEEPLWCVNLKKGLLSQLQLDVTATRPDGPVLKVRQSSETENNVAFNVWEDTMLGDCSTNLQVSRLSEALVDFQTYYLDPKTKEICQGKNFFEVFKTRDLNRCRTNAMKSFVSPGKLECDLGSAKCGESIQRTTVYKYLGCGESPETMTLVSYEGYGELFAKPFLIKTEQLVHTVISTLRLHSQEPLSSQMESPKNSRTFTTLEFDFPEEQASSTLKQTCLEELRLVSKALEASPAADNDITGCLDNAAKILTIFSLDQLKETWDQVKNEGEILKDLFVDVLVSAGSNAAVLFTKDLIEKREIEDSRAVSVAGSLGHYIRTPSRELLQQLIDLLKSETVSSQKELQQSLAVTVGELVNAVCVSPSDSRFDATQTKGGCSPADSLITQDFLPLVSSLLETAEENVDFFAALTALEKLGSDSAIPLLLPLIRGADSGDDTARRTRAILALRQIAKQSPEKVLPLLVSLADNIGERPEVRMAAMMVCFHGNAPLVLWQKLAYRTWIERSRQVAAFTYNALKTIAGISSTSQHTQEIAAKAKTVLPLAKPAVEDVSSWSSLSAESFYLSEGLGYVSTNPQLILSDSSTPVYSRKTLKYQFGPLIVSPFKFELWNYNMDQVWKSVVSQLNRAGFKSSRVVRSFSPRQLFAAGFSELDTLWAQNRLLRRTDDLKTGILSLKVLDSVERTIDLENLDSVVRSALRTSQKKISFSKYSTVAEVDLLLPSDIGIPIRFNSKASGLVSAQGSVKNQGHVTLDVASVLTSKLTSQMRSDLEFCGKYIASGVDVRTEIRGPRHLQLLYKPGNLQLSWKPSSQVSDLFFYQVKPYTTSRVILAPIHDGESSESSTVNVNPPAERRVPLSDVFGVKLDLISESSESSTVNVNPPAERRFPLDDLFGVKLDLISSIETDYHDYKNLLEFLQKWDLQAFLTSGFVPLSVRHKVIRIRYSPEDSGAEKIDLNFRITSKPETDSSAVVFASGTPNKLPKASESREEQREISITVDSKRNQSEDIHLGLQISSSKSLNRSSVKFSVEKTSTEKNGSQKIDYKICGSANSSWNSPPSFGLSRQKLEKSIDLEFNFGSCSSESKIVVEAKLSRNEEAANHAQNSNGGMVCSQQLADKMLDSQYCSEARELDATYNTYEASVTATDPPELVKSILNRSKYSLIHYLYPFVTDIQSVDTPNVWRFNISRYPGSSDFDLQLSTPYAVFSAGRIRGLDSSIGSVLNSFVEKSLEMKVSDESVNQPRCYLSPGRIYTFDSVPYEYQINSCYHTLVTDCTKQQRFIILAKTLETRFILKVVTDKDVVEIDPAGSVTINGMVEPLDAQQKYEIRDRGSLMVSVQRTTDGAVRTTVEGVEVKLKDTQITVTPSVNLRGKACGLCGDYDLESVLEFKTGSRCVVSSGALMASAFQVNFNDQCPKIAEELAADLQSQTSICFSADERTRSALPLSDLKKPSECEQMRPLVIESNGKKCVSTTAVLHCRPDCQPKRLGKVSLGFSCRDPKISGDPEQWKVVGSEEDFRQQVIVPGTCVPW